MRALQRLRALLLTAEHAKLLHAREGDAGLLVERLGFLRDGRAVEFCQTYYRGDTYDFVAELSSPSEWRDPAATLMHREAAQAPAVVRAQLARNRDAADLLGRELRALAPRAVVTCARGSSDHAATFAKYLLETRLGILTASAAPSIASVYGARQDLRDCCSWRSRSRAAAPISSRPRARPRRRARSSWRW